MRRIIRRIIGIGWVLCVTGCTWIEKDYPNKGMSAEQGYTGVYIQAFPAMPVGTTYYFYNKYGQKVYEKQAGDDGCMEQHISEGYYRVLAVPPHFSVSGMEHYSTARIGLEATRTRSLWCESMKEHAAILRDSFDLPKGMIKYLTSSQCAVSHKLTLSIESTSPMAIHALRGEMNGAYKNAHLATGKPAGNVQNNSFSETYINFIPSLKDGIWTVTIYSFGFRAPSVANYTGIIKLLATTIDGDTIEEQIDITDSFSALADAEGNIPSGSSLQITAAFNQDKPKPEPNPEPSNPGGEIDDWEPGDPNNPGEVVVE